MNRGAWRATVCGITKSWTWLSTHTCMMEIIIPYLLNLWERYYSVQLSSGYDHWFWCTNLEEEIISRRSTWLLLIFYDSQSMIEFYQLIIYPIIHSRTKYRNDHWVSMWTHHEINQGQDSFIYFLKSINSHSSRELMMLLLPPNHTLHLKVPDWPEYSLFPSVQFSE